MKLHNSHIVFKGVLMGMLVLATSILKGQEHVTTLGVQLKPMIPSKFFGNGTKTVEEENYLVGLTPKMGLNFGMVVRRGFTKTWSFETGICMVQRNFELDFNNPELKEPKKLNFRYVCYEIPLQGIVFVKLGDQLYMNASGGFSLDMYPSNVTSSDFEKIDTLNFDFYQKTWRTSWLQFSLLANYGFEWRSKESGYFYVGVSYHRPFKEIGLTQMVVERNTDPTRMSFLLSGNYLTADFRYFFHEKPERKKPKS